MLELLLVRGCFGFSGGNTIKRASSQEPSGCWERTDWSENTHSVSVSGLCCNQSKDQWSLDQGRGRWETEEGRRSELFRGKVSWSLGVSESEDRGKSNDGRCP